MSAWWQTLGMIVGGGGVAGLLGSLITGLLNRPTVRADAVARLTESALKQVDELQERTAEAERRATAAEQAADQARTKVRLLSDELDSLLATLRAWRAAILAPSADLDQLRVMVSSDPGAAVNGRPR